MKKLIATSTFITTLVSVSYATELKGSDCTSQLRLVQHTIKE
ncbi:MAG: hypothetical protein AB8U93_01165 [Francisella endosymbiont of Hyalomma scupense]